MSYRCRGFRFGATHAGVKSTGALDVGVMISAEPASTAAVFTTNEVAAAPVALSRKALLESGGVARAIVVNSGNANACTGPQGVSDARRMVSVTARALGVPASSVLVSSTGVIGEPLPIDAIAGGIEQAISGARAGDFGRFAGSILTTDRGTKTARRKAGGDTIIGCTKGAGMIAPNMATTLSFVASDATVGPGDLAPLLADAVAGTFNAITVDGDTSTNDMVAVMCNGTATRPLRGKKLAAFGEALESLLAELARKLMREGEGVHHVVDVVVRGARTTDAARAIARTIANSPLVKTAIAGGDPNWGRVLAAAGRAGVKLRANRLDLWLDDVQIARDGAAADLSPAGEKRAARVMAKPSYRMIVDLHQGRAEATYLACDLSHVYVSINADYRT